MKINWGTGIIIAFVLFISFILYFVITILSSNEFDHNLVTEEYYKAELAYQDDINAEKNANQFLTTRGKTTENGWEITFPENIDYTNISGKVEVYKPSDKLQDFTIPFKLNNNKLLIPLEKFNKGRWNIRIEFKQNNENYLIKDEINL